MWERMENLPRTMGNNYRPASSFEIDAEAIEDQKQGSTCFMELGFGINNEYMCIYIYICIHAYIYIHMYI